MYDSHFYFDENLNKFYSHKDGTPYEDIFHTLEPINGDYILHTVDDVPITFSKNSKIIKFIEDEKSKEIFVINANQVLFLIKKFKYEHYEIDGKNSKEVNINDNLNFFQIKYLKHLLFQEDFNKANENIIEKEKILLDNLSLMYYDYQKVKVKSEFILTEERKQFFKKLYDLNQTKRFIPICGPKYIGKTTSLLYYLKVYARMKYFYINLKHCQKLILKGKKEELMLCICKELFNCMPFEDVLNFYNTINEKTYINVMDIILDIVKYTNDKFPNNKYYFVLDQYKEKLDKNYKIIKEIEIMTKVDNKFDVFVCSSINEFDFRNSLNKIMENSDDFFLNYLFVNKLILVDNIKIIEQLNKEEIQLLNDSGNLYLYFYQIRENKLYEKKPIEETRKEIMNHIIEEINEYFNENDNNKKISIIGAIHDSINQKKKFIDLKDKLSLIPLKYFNLTINKQNMFIIEDLKKETEISIVPCYTIVIDCINKIFQNSKYELKKYSSNEITENTKKSEQSNTLEKNFNDYLWIYKNSFSFYGCKIVDKIKITSLMDMNESDGKIIKEAANKLKNVNESILITQKYQNARHYDTAILKLIKIDKDNENEKFFELYLFQETIKKKADERLFNLTLIEDRICLKFIFYLNSEIKIDNIYFSYVFDKNDTDNTTKNYCIDLNINYLIYDDNIPSLFDSTINPLIKPKIEFPLIKKMNSTVLKKEYPLEIFDINFSDDKEKLKEENKKLNDFLNRKRNFRKENGYKALSNKIKNIKKYVGDDFRNYEIEDNIVQDYLMKDENEKILGLSYLIDKETKKFITNLNFNQTEKDNLYECMKKYNNAPEILKIIKLDGFLSLNYHNYDCCILQVNSKGEKVFIDVKSQISCSLKNKKITKSKSIELDGDFYLIKFATKNMVFEN